MSKSLRKWGKITLVGAIIFMLSIDTASACRWLRARRCAPACAPACHTAGPTQAPSKGAAGPTGVEGAGAAGGCAAGGGLGNTERPPEPADERPTVAPP